MNGQQLKDAAIKLYGNRGWQSRLAEALGRDVSSVRRWACGQIPVPAPVALALQALKAAKR